MALIKITGITGNNSLSFASAYAAELGVPPENRTQITLNEYFPDRLLISYYLQRGRIY
jgi:hypothetical protein